MRKFCENNVNFINIKSPQDLFSYLNDVEPFSSINTVLYTE